MDSDRPRERLLNHGGDRVTNEELIALILGSGIAGRSAVVLAGQLLSSSGGILTLARAAPHELIATPGVGPARAARLVAAFHLGRRVLEAEVPESSAMSSAEDIYVRLRGRMSGLVQELFVVVALDIRNVVIDVIEVARGCLTGVEVHPREVFRPLIRQAAAAAVVAHNHPSGDPTPSPEDILLTERLREVGELVGVPILDHVIIGDRSYRSVVDYLGS